jgi:hypothetical protein
MGATHGPRNTDRTRSTQRFIRTPDTAERDAEACRLRVQGLTFDAIAKQLGYEHRSSAQRAVERCLAATVAEPAAHLRAVSLQRLDAALAIVWKIMEGRHVAVSHGRVVLDPATGEPLVDHGPNLQAIDRVVRLEERRARLLGLDAPVRVENIGPDDVDREVARLAALFGVTGEMGR